VAAAIVLLYTGINLRRSVLASLLLLTMALGGVMGATRSTAPCSTWQAVTGRCSC